ncbi:bifunctional phosphopantothenoylcysteine decarboxylase/phosphopantothenate--cysteine ligase CoaBC [Sulfurimonas sp.]|nr:bifunctional phosphopantothenoylcysteine decarboxylase/phosphopantothenate--cysteine ligase CoaBC [Sulfurimonas sp.]
MLIPNDLLKNKKVLLGVTGSIAVYKSLEIVRYLVKAGAEVKVIMSESAKKFVTPLTFETLTSNQILDDNNESWVDEHNHIKAGDWADMMLIAPATANTIAKLSHAVADSILLQTALAYPGVKLLAPSANTNMIESPITQDNLRLLKLSKYEFVDTQVKELACKTTGNGAMAEPIDIFWACARKLLEDNFWLNRSVIVTGGGTIEKIDDVRYISNYSSGKMASSLATALYCKGADVELIASKFENELPTNLNTLHVESSNEMYKSLSKSLHIVTKKEKKPYLFMAAAVSDYVPQTIQEGKLKKDLIGDTWDMKLKQNIDILKSIDKADITTVGFKAEMDKTKALDNALSMISKKDLDAVCLNILQDSSSFGTDNNKVEFISKDEVKSIHSADKVTVSLHILEHSKTL